MELAPIQREWDFFSELTTESTLMLELRLVYQGLLKSSGNSTDSPHKHSIRRYFHPQLVNAWNIRRPLKAHMKGVREKIASKYQLDGKCYLPLVSNYFESTCSLDILLLRRNLKTIIVSGDLDGRIKTLIDALSIPVHGEKTGTLRQDPNPFYCLMEDDN